MMNGIQAGLGTASFGTSISPEDSYKVLDKYASLGGRIIDTANNYAYWHPKGKGGDSESAIGNWLERGDRSLFTIMTKIGSQLITTKEGSPKLEGLSPAAVHDAVNKSLARLKTDYIDILLAHHDDRNTPLLDTWKSFSDLVAAGKVKKVGISNYSPQRLTELAHIALEYSLAPVDFVQLKYSLIDPVKDSGLGTLMLLNPEMRETLARLLPKAVIFAYSPLLGGNVFEKTSKDKWPSEYDSIQNREKVGEIQLKAGELGVSPSAYVLKQIADQGIWPITATGNTERLEANLQLFSAYKTIN